MNRTQCLKVVCAGVVLILAGCAVPSGALDRNHGIPAESPGWERKMGGIVFFSTRKLMDMKDFYMNRVGCRLWLDQGDCLIFQHGNFLIGFCKGREADKAGIITFFYEDKGEVDRMYEKFKSTAPSKPKMNEKFRIYHFFVRDPEERTLEFQYFDHELPPY
jgi:hypothetical protein